MREVIVDRDDIFGTVKRFIPENDKDREELKELGIEPFTGEIWHVEDDRIVYETIQ